MNQELFDLAVQVGREAAELVRTRRPAGRVAVAATKSTETDPVTEIDAASEALLRERIAAARPDDGFVGEEGEDLVGTSGIDWIVDPIDGTVNFIYGIGAYAVSIAARDSAGMVVGYVINVATGQEWAALRGGGAFRLDGGTRVISTPRQESLGGLLVATGFGYDPLVRAEQGASVAQLLPQVRDIRRIGAAALDLCAVAEGSVDAYVERGLAPWDYAAGALIASEAGCIVDLTDVSGGRQLVMVTHHEMAPEYFALVRACGF